ncbi:MAG: 3-oxoacyl-ACP reductase FabG [Bifidobacteriaceae bacterium]|nr:3-oxoacyl-ACP reductase FabG [Bifidobacteriaceae bacterium]
MNEPRHATVSQTADPSTSLNADQAALVTGASRGIGLAAALQLRQAGFPVTALARHQPAVPAALNLAADVTNAADLKAAFQTAEQTHGPVTVLVVAAGIVRDGLVLRQTEDDYDAVLETNLKAAWRCVKYAAPGMIKRRHGRIILIGSVVGLYGGPGQSNYCAAKAGLVGLARSVARELGPRGITANVIAPGFIETDMTAGLPESRRQAYQAAIPAARFGVPADVAHLVTFLASPQANYINGAVIPVDGGLGMGH